MIDLLGAAYGWLLRAAFPRRYPRDLLREARGAFEDGLSRRRARDGTARALAWALRTAGRGVVDGLAERAREAGGAARGLGSGWVADVRFGVRRAVRRPGAAVVVVVSLWLGLGVNAVLFGAVRGLLLRPLPVPEPDRLVRLFGPEARSTLDGVHAPEAVEALHRAGGAFRGVAGTRRFTGALEAGGEALLASGEIVTPGYFDVLGVRPARGRGFGDGEGREGGGAVAVVSAGVAARLGDDAVGATIRLDRRAVTVVGVAPEGFRGSHFARSTDLWIPTGTAASARLLPGPREPSLRALARLAPGASLADADAELARVVAALRRDAPESYAESGWFALPERAGLINPAAPGLVAAGGALAVAASLLVLLVACANVAGLGLARAVGRRRELGVRAALGAGRTRLVRQLLVESAVLVVPAAALALWTATATGPLLRGLVPVLAELSVDFSPDGRVVAFVAGSAVLAGLLTGTLPALWAAGRRPGGGAGARGEVGGGPRRLLDAMVALQVAFAVVVLVGGGLFVRTLLWYRAAEPGYATDGRVALEVDAGLHALEGPRARALFDALVDGARALPSVSHAALAGGIAVGGPVLEVPVPGDGSAPPLRVSTNVVGPGYFETLAIGLREGRGFGPADGPDGDPVAVVNEQLARILWPGGDAVGRTLAAEGGSFRVVGVAEDLRYGSLAEAPRPFAYLPAARHPAARRTLVAAGTGPTDRTLEALRALLRELEPGLPPVGATTVEAFVDADRLLARAAAALGVGLGLVALLLAGVGVFGTAAFAVRTRRREIGVRMSLGASPRSILGLVTSGGLRVAGVAAAAGLVLATAGARAVRGLLVGTGPFDPWSAGAALLLVGAVLTVALGLPARRAARLDPADALREG